MSLQSKLLHSWGNQKMSKLINRALCKMGLHMWTYPEAYVARCQCCGTTRRNMA